MIFPRPSIEPSHHPSTETLTAYAAGTLRPGFDFVTAAHVRNCSQCAAEVRRLEALGGALLSEVEPSALSEEALARALARIEAPMQEPPPSARTMDDILNAAKRRWAAPGIWTAQLDTPHAPGDRVYLLGAAPGCATARHSHAGIEFTQVLKGALDDESIVYRAGDFCERDPGHTHHPKAVGDEFCVCLFASQGRLRPTGLIGRISFLIAGV